MENVQARGKLLGRRKSLLVGINYFGTPSELGGCINDVERMRPLLQELGFPAEHNSQQVLLDDGHHRRPSRANMIDAMRWLTSDAQTGDVLFFHYSGHGGREPSSDAADGYHETLCPVDYNSAGQLLDTELFELLVRPLPSGAKLTCLLDCCHSAGALNLPYLFTGTQENLQQALIGKAVGMAMSKNWVKDLALWNQGDHATLLQDVASMGLGIWNLWSQCKEAKGANSAGFSTELSENASISIGEVVAFTGCRSDQTSADVGNVAAQFHIPAAGPSGQGSLLIDQQRIGSGGGALTSVFIESLEEARQDRQLTYLDLLERMRMRLASDGFSQVPQFASSLVLELNQPFAVDEISLPPKPEEQRGARGFGGGTVGEASSQGVSSFMSAMAAKPLGMAMLQGPTVGDGGAPYAELLRLGGSAGLAGFFGGSGGGEAGHCDLGSSGAPLQAPRGRGSSQACETGEGFGDLATALQNIVQDQWAQDIVNSGSTGIFHSLEHSVPEEESEDSDECDEEDN